MPLSPIVIDRLFAALFNIYGSQWLHQWKDNDITEVKAFWAEQLGFYANNLTAIAWALEHLPDRAPNLIQFKKLCNDAPALNQAPAIDYTKAAPIPQAIAVELKKITAPRETDHKAWAKRILKDVEDGIKRAPISVRFAKEALNIKI
jgi:hypothetical protein